MENKVLAVITPDTILQDDYIQAVRNEGLGDYLQPEEKADSAEAPAFDIGMGVSRKRPYRLEQSRRRKRRLSDDCSYQQRGRNPLLCGRSA